MLSYDTHKHTVDLSHGIHTRVERDASLQTAPSGWEASCMYGKFISFLLKGKCVVWKNLCIVVEVSKWQPLDLFSDPLSGSNSKQNVAEGMQEYLKLKHPEGDPPAGDAIPPPRSPWIMNPNQHGIKDSSRSAAHTFVGRAPHLSPSVHFRISVWGDLGHRQRSRSRGWEKGRAPRQESVIFKLL